jgi:DNA (cytosine-5)-methyltransferase 1
MINQKSMKAIELFTGAGGLAMGISSASFSHEMIVEWNEYACDTIRQNQKRRIEPVCDWPEVIQSDVKLVDFKQYSNKLDLVAGGPPCQPFSLGGKHKGYNDNRDMFPQAVRAVREAMPKAFIFENVKGLLRPSFASYFKYIILQMSYPEIIKSKKDAWTDHLSKLEKYHTRGKHDGLHYRVVFQVLNAANYGIPQKRERVFMVGFRSDLNVEWSFPKQTHSGDSLDYDKWVSGNYWNKHGISKRIIAGYEKPDRNRIEKLRNDFQRGQFQSWRTIRDAISDLPKPTRAANNGTVLNHELNGVAKIYPGHTGSLIDEPSKTLKAGAHGVPGGENMIVFPDNKIRYLTIREAARIQDFPDNYLFHGSWTECMRQLGNAVPVGLASAVAKSVASEIETIDKKRNGIVN